MTEGRVRAPDGRWRSGWRRDPLSPPARQEWLSVGSTRESHLVLATLGHIPGSLRRLMFTSKRRQSLPTSTEMCSGESRSGRPVPLHHAHNLAWRWTRFPRTSSKQRRSSASAQYSCRCLSVCAADKCWLCCNAGLTRPRLFAASFCAAPDATCTPRPVTADRVCLGDKSTGVPVVTLNDYIRVHFQPPSFWRWFSSSHARHFAPPPPFLPRTRRPLEPPPHAPRPTRPNTSRARAPHHKHTWERPVRTVDLTSTSTTRTTAITHSTAAQTRQALASDWPPARLCRPALRNDQLPLRPLASLRALGRPAQDGRRRGSHLLPARFWYLTRIVDCDRTTVTFPGRRLDGRRRQRRRTVWTGRPQLGGLGYPAFPSAAPAGAQNDQIWPTHAPPLLSALSQPPSSPLSNPPITHNHAPTHCVSLLQSNRRA